MEDSNTVHPIACESCRNKKSKCDRELPVCSQCSATGTSCRYPPMNKRGIPSGYISLIEQRLLDTETIVIELLSAIHNSQIPIEPHRLNQDNREALAAMSQKQAKTKKIDEWKEFPILTDEQRHAWWRKKRELLAQLSHSSRSVILHESPAQSEEWSATPITSGHEGLLVQPDLLVGPSIRESQYPITSWQPSQEVIVTPNVFADSTISQNPASESSHLDLMLPEDDPPYDNSSAPPTMNANSLGSQYGATGHWRKYF
ncbi:hypothetical protein T440DRAFT_556104 [Plenodomus tracheiphilus IPT5]|uniref:Zn(2)-C6 fungal-type domain-containing protein n=1 Tax=Plenodomus tracheiphilus IPT5 TaxID=1408161 RepID=A0A6A7B0X8_9PLEO|nr:hypothetical protein T440DRAFT_556104 [Plenodomus tracheiphilus IPT5]